MPAESTLWQFDKVAADDTERAEALSAAPSRTELALQVGAALRLSVSNRTVRIGFDESGTNARPVIQFHVGQQLFDWFFNAHTGYRAQFRNGWEIGHAFNADLVGLLRDELASALEDELLVRRLNSSFEDIGCERVTRSRILESLAPELSKVWFCKKLIHHDGKISVLPVQLSGPRLVFDEYDSWAAPFADEPDAWLDLKGAFLGPHGPYQLKDPILRAKDLQRLGTA